MRPIYGVSIANFKLLLYNWYGVYKIRPIYAVFLAHFMTLSYPRISSIVCMKLDSFMQCPLLTL